MVGSHSEGAGDHSPTPTFDLEPKNKIKLKGNDDKIDNRINFQELLIKASVKKIMDKKIEP